MSKSGAGAGGKVPFVDLQGQAQLYRDEWRQAIQGVLDSGRFIGGEEVKSFEREFSSYVGTKFGIGTGSGADALRLALLALGVGPGDEVVTVSHTFVASADCIVHVGAKPVFVDIDPETYTMDPKALEKAISPKVRAVLPVHLYGQSADVDAILEICRKHGLPMVEDAAQAHGARYRGRPCGSMGSLSCFSFYPSKNLGALGDGGFVATSDAELAEKVRLLHEYGQVEKYRHVLVGFNSRLDALHAAVLRRKLTHLDAWNNARRRAAERYARALQGIPGVSPPSEAPHRQHIYHVYAVRTPHRADLQSWLGKQEIETGIHYPIPVHMQPAYTKVDWRAGDLKESVRASQEVLSLPMYPEISDEQVDRVCRSVSEWARHPLQASG